MTDAEIYRPEDADAIAARIQAATGTRAVIPTRARGAVMEFVTAESTTLERDGEDWIVVDTERGQRQLQLRTDGFSAAVRFLADAFARFAPGLTFRFDGGTVASEYSIDPGHPVLLTWIPDERGSWAAFSGAGAADEAKRLSWFLGRSIEDIARIKADPHAVAALLPGFHAGE